MHVEFSLPATILSIALRRYQNYEVFQLYVFSSEVFRSWDKTTAYGRNIQIVNSSTCGLENKATGGSRSPDLLITNHNSVLVLTGKTLHQKIITFQLLFSRFCSFFLFRLCFETYNGKDYPDYYKYSAT